VLALSKWVFIFFGGGLPSFFLWLPTRMESTEGSLKDCNFFLHTGSFQPFPSRYQVYLFFSEKVLPDERV